MAQDPPSGVVCSAGVVDICCLFSLSNTITSYGDRDLCIYDEAVICPLRVALKSRTVDPNRSAIQTDLRIYGSRQPPDAALAPHAMPMRSRVPVTKPTSSDSVETRELLAGCEALCRPSSSPVSPSSIAARPLCVRPAPRWPAPSAAAFHSIELGVEGGASRAHALGLSQRDRRADGMHCLRRLQTGMARAAPSRRAWPSPSRRCPSRT